MTALQRRNAVSEERERLMRDMHDGVGSQLMATLNAFERGQLPSAQVGELLRECIEDLRLVIDSLDAGEHTLAAALANLRYRIEPRLAAAGLGLVWDVDAMAGSRLAPGAVLHVLRVVQEALNNALKHAQATRLSVRAIDEPSTGTFRVEVSDDGVGGLPTTRTGAATTGRGLDNMRQRARSLGGELELVAQTRGTSVRLRVLSDPRERDEREELP
jgi:signal transduction histidine kinase